VTEDAFARESPPPAEAPAFVPPAPAFQPPADDAPAPRRPARPPGKALGVASFVLSFLALAAGLTALGLVLFRNPLGHGMSRYKFSTPKEALVSTAEMEMNQDIRALLEYQAVQGKPRIKERLKTLVVSKEADWKDKKVLFILYEEKGEKKYQTVSFEKDTDSGLWYRTYVSSYEVQKEDKALAEEMRAWEAKGEKDKKKNLLD
jgi:hypothetical protein